MVFAGIFIFIYLLFPFSASGTSDPVVLVDDVAPSSLTTWTVNNPGGNPIFTYEEIVSPFDGSTAIKTSVVGSSYSPCHQPSISKDYPVSGNTTVTSLQAYLAFTSTMDTYNFPYLFVEIYDADEERVGSQVYYGKDIVGSWYKTNRIDVDSEAYTELQSTAGDMTLDLSVMGEDIDFTSLKVTLANYACIGENSVTFDHLRVVDGTFFDPNTDTTPPTGWVELHTNNGEVAGDAVGVSVSLQDSESLVKDVCLWLGDEAENLLAHIPCKTLEQRGDHSYDYAPSFSFVWDSTGIDDGTYDLFVIATDNAGNVAKIHSAQPAIINNYSVGSPLLPKEITTCEEFQAINEKLGWYYVVMNDIDCSETQYWNSGNGFTTIGDSSSSFTGFIDGQNYHISNITQKTYNSRLFESVTNTIKNLNFRDVDIYCSGSYCSGIAGFLTGKIERSSITGTLTCTGSHCTASAIAHQNSGTIAESWAGMSLLGGRGQGLVASQIGFGWGSMSEIRDSYFRGIMSEGYSGLLGTHNENSHVSNSYSVADFGDPGYNAVGGLIGFHHYYKNSSITNSFWDATFSGVTKMCASDQWNSAYCIDDRGLSTADMKNINSFTGWDFENVWAIDPAKNDGYPYLQWQTSFYSPSVPHDGDSDNGDEENPPSAEEPAEVVTAETGSRSSGTRVGQRRSAEQAPGQVLGAAVTAEEELRLQHQRQIVTLLQQLVALLTQLVATR